MRARTRGAEDRWERGNRLCRLISERVSDIASPGLGLWDSAWRIVEDPSTHFFDALREWEETGTKESREALEQATYGLVKAWKQAEEDFQSHAVDLRTKVSA